MSLIWIVRLFILVSSLFLAVVVLGLSANYVAKYTLTIPGIVSFTTPPWAALSIATSVITIVFVTPMIIIDILRKGAFTSWVMIELIVVSVISILWLADAADATAVNNATSLKALGLPATCKGLEELAADIDALEISRPATYGFLKAIDFDQFPSLCRQHEVVQAFAYLSWILLMGYAITLLVLAIMASVRNAPGPIWKGTVRDTDFFATGPGKGADSAANSVPMTQQLYTPTPVTPTVISTPVSGPGGQAYAPVPNPGPYAAQV